jgi:Fe-S-cluster containining protein
VNGWIPSRDGQAQGQRRGIGLADQSRNQVRAEASVTMLGEQRDVYQPQFRGRPRDYDLAYRTSVFQDDAVLGAGIGCLVRQASGVKLHSQEGLLLSGRPTPCRDLGGARGGVHLPKKILIGGCGGTRGEIRVHRGSFRILHDWLGACPTLGGFALSRTSGLATRCRLATCPTTERGWKPRAGCNPAPQRYNHLTVDKLLLRFGVLDESISVEADPLPDPARLDEMLPILRVLDDQAVEIAARRHGQAVTCAKGCSMCCRIQPVPVTPAEAYALLRLVESLPEPRRAQVIERFADRTARLEEAGLAETYDGGRAHVSRYLELQLSCPFLENDECSIYAARPLVCREFLVTSPKEMCAEPLTAPVERVPIVLIPAASLLQTGTALSGREQQTIPLTLALRYAERHRAELEGAYPAAQVLAQTIQDLFSMAHERGSLPAESR